jgi:hypothetical protein
MHWRKTVVFRWVGRNVLGHAAPERRCASCPDCGRARLKRYQNSDRIERRSQTLWSTLSQLLGGKLYHCPLCRVQFYDLRMPARHRHVSETSQNGLLNLSKAIPVEETAKAGGPVTKKAKAGRLRRRYKTGVISPSGESSAIGASRP